MCKFGLEITSVLSGTTCPVQVAQYDRYIHERKIIKRSVTIRVGKNPTGRKYTTISLFFACPIPSLVIMLHGLHFLGFKFSE